MPCTLMDLKSALYSAIDCLESHEVGSPRMNAEMLLMHTLDCDRAYLFAHPERELSAKEIAVYIDLIQQRARGIPAQYLVGHQEFWGLDFLVSPAVLIPRPETEHVIETVLALSQQRSKQELTIVDVGTGSGCIALALAHELPAAKITAADISTDALAVAQKNTGRLGLADRVKFQQGDLLSGFDPSARFDFIVSNPPYVGEAEPEKVQREVREAEPRIAVFAGQTGMEIYGRLIPQASKHLKPDGWLVMEIGYSIEGKVRELLAGWNEIRTTNDLQGIPRVVAARP